MKTAVPRSPADRDRAVARLRALTIGSTLASFAAVGGFGAMAALSYDGTSTDVTTAAITSSTTTPGSSSTSDSSTSTSTSTTTGTPAATAAPTATTGTAHVATGSS